MENNINKTMGGILLLLIPLSLLFCNNKTEPSSNKTEQESSLVDTMKHDKFVPDTSVNTILFLTNPASCVNFLPTLDKIRLVEKVREAPVIIMVNKINSEYLLLYQFEGSITNSYSKFEIVDTKEIDKMKAVPTKYENFATESGLKLNMSLDEVVAKKGNNFIRETDSKIIYRINDFNKSVFLKRYNMPAYFMECSFKEGRLYKLIYGFEYP